MFKGKLQRIVWFAHDGKKSNHPSQKNQQESQTFSAERTAPLVSIDDCKDTSSTIKATKTGIDFDVHKHQQFQYPNKIGHSSPICFPFARHEPSSLRRASLSPTNNDDQKHPSVEQNDIQHRSHQAPEQPMVTGEDKSKTMEWLANHDDARDDDHQIQYPNNIGQSSTMCFAFTQYESSFLKHSPVLIDGKRVSGPKEQQHHHTFLKSHLRLSSSYYSPLL